MTCVSLQPYEVLRNEASVDGPAPGYIRGPCKSTALLSRMPKKRIGNQQTRQSRGTRLHFEKLDTNHSLPPPLLMDHVQFHKVRCLLFPHELALANDKINLPDDQQSQFVVQVTFLVCNAQDSLQVSINYDEGIQLDG